MLVTPGLSQLWVNFNGLMLCYCPETFNYKSNDINHVMVNTINTTAQLNHFSEIRTPQSGSVCSALTTIWICGKHSNNQTFSILSLLVIFKTRWERRHGERKSLILFHLITSSLGFLPYCAIFNTVVQCPAVARGKKSGGQHLNELCNKVSPWDSTDLAIIP